MHEFRTGSRAHRTVSTVAADSPGDEKGKTQKEEHLVKEKVSLSRTLQQTLVINSWGHVWSRPLTRYRYHSGDRWQRTRKSRPEAPPSTVLGHKEHSGP